MSPILEGVGPEEVDEVGELGKRVGVHNQASRLIAAAAAAYPEELASAMSRNEDPARTAYLDLDEVVATAQDAGHDSLESLKPGEAAVRGEGDNAFVSFFYATPGGRTVKAAIPYKDLSASQSAYEDALDASNEGGALDADTASLKKELAAAKKAIADAEARAEAAEKAAAESGDGEGAGSGSEEVTEPYDGYGDAVAADVVSYVEASEDDAELESILNAEEAGQGTTGKTRKGVVTAITKRREELAEGN